MGTHTDLAPYDPTTSSASHFYVSAIDPDRTTRRWLMAGPYTTEADARANVSRVRTEAEKHDRKAAWMAWGTAGSLTDEGPGIMNQKGLL